jgi:hypothetical protein
MRPIYAVLLLALAACAADEHPKAVVGAWVKDSTMPGGSLRVIDSVDLRADGTAGGRVKTITYQPSSRLPSGVDMQVTESSPMPSRWKVLKVGEGQQLCLYDDAGKSRCTPLPVTADSLLMIGPTVYRRAR